MGGGDIILLTLNMANGPETARPISMSLSYIPSMLRCFVFYYAPLRDHTMNVYACLDCTKAFSVSRNALQIIQYPVS